MLMRGLGCVSCPPSASGGLPGWARRGAGREAGCCGEVFAMGIQRRVLWAELAGALIRLLILRKYIQQGGQVSSVRTLLGCSCEPRIECTQTD